MKGKSGFFSNWFQRKNNTSSETITPAKDTGTPAQPEAILPDPFREKHKKNILKRMSSKSEKEQQIATLQAGYFELIDLIRSISGHLELQGQTQKQLLDTLPKALENVSSATREQNTTLEQLKVEMLSAKEQDQKFSDSLNHLSDTLGYMDASRNRIDDSLQVLMQRSERRYQFMVAILVLLLIPTLLSPFYSRSDKLAGTGADTPSLGVTGSASMHTPFSHTDAPLTESNTQTEPEKENPAVPVQTPIDLDPYSTVTGEKIPTLILGIPRPPASIRPQTTIATEDEERPIRTGPEVFPEEEVPGDLELPSAEPEESVHGLIDEDATSILDTESEQEMIAQEISAQQSYYKWVV